MQSWSLSKLFRVIENITFNSKLFRVIQNITFNPKLFRVIEHITFNSVLLLPAGTCMCSILKTSKKSVFCTSGTDREQKTEMLQMRPSARDVILVTAPECRSQLKAP